MKSLLFAAGVLSAAMSIAPALAQDATTDQPSTTSTFTGPRAEIFGGWDRVGTRLRTDDGITRDTTHSHRDGVNGGAQIGYDIALGNRLVAGGFGSYSISTARSCADTGGCLKAGREVEGGVRVGYKLLDGRALGYVKGAYVNGQIRDTYDDIRADRDGWRGGAGIEYALTPHVYTKVEYDYSRFKSLHFDTPDAADSLRFDRNQVEAGFGIRF